MPPPKPASATDPKPEDLTNQPKPSKEQVVWNDIKKMEDDLGKYSDQLDDIRARNTKAFESSWDKQREYARMVDTPDVSPAARNKLRDEINDLTKELEALKVEEEKVKGKLSRVFHRGATPGDADSVKLSIRMGDTDLTKRMKGKANASLKWLDDVSEKGILKGDKGLKEITVKKVRGARKGSLSGRSYAALSDSDYSTGKGVIHMGTDAEEIIIHEIWHLVEDFNPGALERSYRFLKKRAGTKKMKHLGSGYGPREMYVPGTSFESIGNSGKYAAKPYVSTFQRADGYGEGMALPRYEDLKAGDLYATEVGTIGIQKLREDAVGFLKADREWFRQTLGTLRGVYLDDDIISKLD